MLNGVRMKQWNKTDLEAFVAACRNAGRRVQELCQRFSTETYISTLDALLDRNYRAIKQLIETTIPEDGKLSFTDYICDDGMGYGPYKIQCTLWREERKAHRRLRRNRPAVGRTDQLLPQRELLQDAPGDLHDRGLRSSDPLERRLLPTDGGSHPRRIAAQADVSGCVVLPHARPWTYSGHPVGPAWASGSRNSCVQPDSRRLRT